jgi:transposase-like protein
MSYLNTRQAAEHLNISPNTLNKWRINGGGPQYAKCNDNGSVRYSLEKLNEWIEERQRRSTSETPPPVKALPTTSSPNVPTHRDPKPRKTLPQIKAEARDRP